MQTQLKLNIATFRKEIHTVSPSAVSLPPVALSQTSDLLVPV